VFRRIVLFVVGFALIGAACAPDTPSSQPATSSTEAPASQSTSSSTTASTSTTVPIPIDDGFPVTIEAENGPVTIGQRPERILSLSPTSTEVLFAIDAGDQVIAVDDQSNYPPEAPFTGLTSWQPNVEAIAEFDPDLVFISFDPGDVIAGLEAVGITVILHSPAPDLATAFAQWEQTGVASGHIAEAVALVGETQKRLADAVRVVPDEASDLTYYYELDDLYFTATSSSFMGELLSATGLQNVADLAPDPDGFGYPQLSTEFIVDADPALILLADTKCCGQNAETLAERPGWDTLSALSSGGVVELDDDIASRWGPRIVELFESVVAALVAVVSVDA
jgi:iron complex transport system substrate-binding protein